MAAQLAWRAVIAGDDEHARVQLPDLGNLDVEPFDHFDLRGKVPVFAGAVGVLVMNEKKVVPVPHLAERGHLIAER